MPRTTDIAPKDSLLLDPSLIGQLWDESLRAFKAIPHKGLEIGGFLTASGGGAVDSLVTVECHYHFGPAFHLEEPEIEDFAAQVAEVRASGARVAAYFRSCTRDAMELTPDDRELIAKALPEVTFALLAKPRADAGIRFGLFRKDSHGTWSGPEDPGTHEPVPEAPEPQPYVVPPPLEPAARFPKKVVAWGVLALAGLLIFAWIKHREPGPAPVGLRAQVEGGGVHITWDRVNGAARYVRGARLTITDGGVVRVVTLDRTEFLSGSVVYQPHSDDVSIRMDVGEGPAATSGAIRLVGGAQPVREEPAPLPSGVLVSQLPAAARRQVAEPVPTPAAPRQIMEPPPERAVPTSRRSAATPEAPPVVGTVPAAGEIIPDALRTAVAPPPAVQHPSEESRRPQPTLVMSTPPKPIVTVAPDTRDLNWKINFPTEVAVRVQVDGAGRVIGARPAGTQRSGALVGPSLRAASQWRFAPGTQDGKPVPSEYLITFRFKPK